MANSTKISEYSTTAANNTSIDSIDIDENCAASGINNAIRSVLKHQADAFTQGTPIALDQTNNRVGIGNASPDFNLSVGNSSGVNPSIQIMSASNSNAQLLFGDGAGAAGYRGTLVYSNATDSMSFSTAGAERMRIDSSGNVGIGTTVTGDAELIVYGADAGTIYKNSVTGTGGADGFYVGLGKSNGTDAYVYQRENTNLIFGTNDTERMRIDSSGNLQVGTTQTFPAFNNVVGCEVGGFGQISASRNGAEAMQLNRKTSDGDIATFRREGTQVGAISVSGSSTSYNTSSDHRLKENVADMTGAIDRVKVLAPKRFNFIADADTTVDGFLAHEAQAVVPEAVTGTHNEVDDDGNPVMQGIDQSKLVPLLTGALQEAITKIETLETEMTALKARVTALEA